MSLTTDPDNPCLSKTRPDGQQECYLILSDEERTKGFVRPLRRSYIHVGFEKPQHPLRDLTDDERERFAKTGYVKYEEYPEPRTSSALGRYWTQAQLDLAERGCGVATTMGLALCETYARDPSFYSGTFCVGCGKHFPLRLPNGEPAFLWEDGAAVGS